MFSHHLPGLFSLQTLGSKYLLLFIGWGQAGLEHLLLWLSAYLGLLCGYAILTWQLITNGDSRCSFKRAIITLTQSQSSPSSIHLKCWAYVEFGCKFCCSYKDSKLLCGSSLFESCFGRGFFKMKVSERVHKCKGISKRKMLEHPRSWTDNGVD